MPKFKLGDKVRTTEAQPDFTPYEVTDVLLIISVTPDCCQIGETCYGVIKERESAGARTYILPEDYLDFAYPEPKAIEGHRVGDIVECIMESDHGFTGVLGKRYEIRDITDCGDLLLTNEGDLGLMPSRFKVIERTEPAVECKPAEPFDGGILHRQMVTATIMAGMIARYGYDEDYIKSRTIDAAGFIIRTVK